MLNEAQLRNLVLGSKGNRRGGALFHLTSDRQSFSKQLPKGQSEFLRGIVDAPRSETRTVPDHPEAAAGRRMQRRQDGDLSPTELMWLQRLPTDPAAVSFDDAVELASLARSISAVDTPSSARLINSIWHPVKQLHDKAVTSAELAQAREPLPSLPSSLESAMFEAVQAQFPDLGSESIGAEAQRKVTAINQERQRVHAERLSRAERAAAQAEEAVAAHGQTTREVTV